MPTSWRSVRIPDITTEVRKLYSSYTMKFSLHGPLFLSTSTRESHPSGGYLAYAYAHLTIPSSSGAVELSLKHNGVEFTTISIPEDEEFADVEIDPSELVSAVTDYVEVELTSIGVGSESITVFGVFS